VRVSDAEIAQWPRKDGKPAEFAGRLQARAKGSGRGTSLHEVAASSDGTLSIVLPHGEIRKALAELTGLDLKALGLVMAKSAAVSDVRCAAAGFQMQKGSMTAQTLVIDTAPMLISGTGTIALETESLDLTLRGHPKGPELRLRAPIRVKGTLAEPAFAVEAGHAGAQAAGAVALGVLLTPLASLLAFVDPGLAKDADCSALITGAKSVEAPPAAHIPRPNRAQ
jgi:uncharacterized protein involved in outer membrane biogenesis